MKAGRLSLDTLTHQKAPKKKKPRAASDTRASMELVRIRLCRVGSDALQLNPQYASGFPRLGENGASTPRPKGKPRMDGCAISGLVIAPSSHGLRWQVSGPEGVNSRPRCASCLRGR